jgi:hypothetical protein
VRQACGWVVVMYAYRGRDADRHRDLSVGLRRRHRSGASGFGVVIEFEKANGVRVVFGFERSSPWAFRSFKLVVPLRLPTMKVGFRLRLATEVLHGRYHGHANSHRLRTTLCMHR